jgi:hypothetical protein
MVLQASMAAGAMETAAVSGCRMAVTSATEESAMALTEAQGQPMQAASVVAVMPRVAVHAVLAALAQWEEGDQVALVVAAVMDVQLVGVAVSLVAMLVAAQVVDD